MWIDFFVGILPKLISVFNFGVIIFLVTENKNLRNTIEVYEKKLLVEITYQLAELEKEKNN